MSTLLIALAIAAIASGFAFLLRRRKADAPSQSTWNVPQQLDRADFARPEAPWLVVAFTSATCHTCAALAARVEPLRSDAVAVEVVDYESRKPVHERYRIDAVPTTLIADTLGVVHNHFVGPVTATDLWAAVAEAREPGSTPPPEAHTRH